MSTMWQASRRPCRFSRGSSRSRIFSTAVATRPLWTRRSPRAMAVGSSRPALPKKTWRRLPWRCRPCCRRRRSLPCPTTTATPSASNVDGKPRRAPKGYADVHYEVDVNGRLLHVNVHRIDGQFLVSVDGREWTIDAARVDAHTLSLILGVSSREVTIAADPVS